jgi:DNA polymerase III subunit delta'
MNVDEAFGLVKHAFENGRLAQAYTIVGPVRGDGMALALRTLALLFCTGRRAPCGACRGCTQTEARTHADTFWVEPQSKSRTITVEQIRELRSRMYQTSLLGGWKAGVIVCADRLGVPGKEDAANVFLKVLEEPPGKSIFLLLTDSPQFLLPTVKSRCQRLSVGRESSEVSEKNLAGLLAVLSAAGPARSKAGSGMVAAVARADRVGAILKGMKDAAQRFEEKLAANESREEDEDTLEARVSARYKEQRAGMMAMLLQWYRDLMLLAGNAGEDCVFHKSSLEALKRQAQGLDLAEAVKQVRVVEEMYQQMERNLPDHLVLTYGFSRLN